MEPKARKRIKGWGKKTKGAFNNLGWRSILQTLVKIGCPRNIYQLVRSYLQDRRVVYSTPISTQKHSYSRGCPQGSCSGPLCWLLVANSLLKMDLGPHVTTMAYADDFVVLVSGPNAYSISKSANIALEKITGWAELHKLQFSAAKTSAVLFRKPHDGGRKRAPRTPPRIRFLGTAVKAVKTQYLGFTIDDKLNGLAHVANICAKMAKYVLVVNLLSRRDWGLSGVVLKLLYKRGLERIATYACGSW